MTIFNEHGEMESTNTFGERERAFYPVISSGPIGVEFSAHMDRTRTCVHDKYDCWECRARMAEEQLRRIVTHSFRIGFVRGREYEALDTLEAMRRVDEFEPDVPALIRLEGRAR